MVIQNLNLESGHPLVTAMVRRGTVGSESTETETFVASGEAENVREKEVSLNSSRKMFLQGYFFLMCRSFKNFYTTYFSSKILLIVVLL